MDTNRFIMKLVDSDIIHTQLSPIIANFDFSKVFHIEKMITNGRRY